MKFVTAEHAASAIKSNNSVFIQGGAATPQHLINAMVNRAPELRDVEIIHLHTEGDAPYAKPEYRENFHTLSLFVSANLRKAVASGEADYYRPCRARSRQWAPEENSPRQSCGRIHDGHASFVRLR